MRNEMEFHNIVVEKLSGILEQFPKKVEEDTPLVQYGLDSMKVIELIVTLENELDFQFEDEDMHISSFKSISSIVKLVTSLQAKARS